LFKGESKYFTIPVKNESDYLDVNQRHVSDEIQNEKRSIFGQFRQSYRKDIFVDDVFSIFKSVVNYESDNLFDFIFNSVEAIVDYLSIETKIIISSTIDIDHSKKNKYYLWAICKKLGYENYINLPGGKKLYDRNEFRSKGINLYFLEPSLIEYQQFDIDFVEGLSIIDVMMFNSPEKISSELLKAYTLV
jgi:hypothetical protein